MVKRIIGNALLYGLFASCLVIVIWCGQVIVQYDSPELVALQQATILFGVGSVLLFQIAVGIVQRCLHLIWERLKIYGYDD